MEISFSGKLDRTLNREAFRLHPYPLSGTIYGTIYMGTIAGYIIFCDLRSGEALHTGWFIAILPCIIAVQYWETYRNRGDPTWATLDRLTKGPLTGKANDEFIEFIIPTASARYQWCEFINYRNTDTMLLLYLAPGRFWSIPRGFFSEQNDWNLLLDFVSKRIPAA